MGWFMLGCWIGVIIGFLVAIFLRQIPDEDEFF